MIIELFGLSNTGKSVLKEKLAQQGYNVLTTKFDERVGRPVRTRETRGPLKIFFFFKYFLNQPLNAVYLFYKLNKKYIKIDKLSTYNYFKIFLMRNKYLASILSKYEQVKDKKEDIFVDEFSHQSLFMIVQNRSTEKELRKIIEKLPAPGMLLLFEQSREKRHKSYDKPHPFKSGANHYPGSWIDKNYAKEWMSAMEHNFEIIKEIIQESSKRDEKFFQNLRINLPGNYKKNIKIAAYKLL